MPPKKNTVAAPKKSKAAAPKKDKVAAPKKDKVEYVRGVRSAYIIFCTEYAKKAGLNKETMGDNFSVGERGKACGKAWEAIKDDNAARKRFDDDAAADIDRFRQEYYDKYGYEAPDGLKTDNNKPKKRKRATAAGAGSEEEDDGGEGSIDASGSEGPAKKKDKKGKGTAAKGGKAEKKPKKKKDPDEPKQGRSAYILFSMERRPVLKDEQPDLQNVDLVRALAAEWQALDETEKELFVIAAAKDKIAAAKEKAAYQKDKVAYLKKKAANDKKTGKA